MSFDLKKFTEQKTYPKQKIVVPTLGSFFVFFKRSGQEETDHYYNQIKEIASAEESNQLQESSPTLLKTLRRMLEEVIDSFDDIIGAEEKSTKEILDILCKHDSLLINLLWSSFQATITARKT